MSDAERAGSTPPPLFSVVVPAYNAAATLAETLDGMLSQTFSDWECVVVDDGSTDATPAIAQGYCDRDGRFRLIRQANAGTAGAYRTGLEAAKADLLVICAADDFLRPEHLAAMDKLIRDNPDYDIYSSNGEYLFQETLTRRGVYLEPKWQVRRSLPLETVIADCFYSVGVVFRRSVLELTGGHRLGVYVDDYDLWLRAMVHGARHLYTPRALSVHRISGFQQSADLARVFASNIEVYENLLGDPAITTEIRIALEKSIERNREAIEEIPVAQVPEIPVVETPEIPPRRPRTRMERFVRKVSRLAKPLRRLLARMRAR